MKYFIAAFTGAIIGYVTNWLAIKMLFRPHKEVRVFGRRLPFTPGLIPKERYRISSSVGKTIGEHLLTKETLVEALANEKMDKHIKKWIGDKIRAMKNSRRSLGELISKALGIRYASFLNRTNEKIVCKVRALATSPESKVRLRETMKEVLQKVLKMPLETIFNNIYVVQAKEFTIDKLKVIRDSENFKVTLRRYIENKVEDLKSSDKTIEDVVPEGIIASLKVYVYSSRKDICDTIQQLLKQPTVSERLKTAIASMINSNFNSLVAAFIKVDTVYSKLISALEEYFKEDENQRNTVMLLNEGIDKLSKEKITELFDKVSFEDKDTVTEALVKLISEKVLTDGLIHSIFRELEQSSGKYSTIDELLSKINEGYQDNISEFLAERFDEFIKTDKSQKIIEKLVLKIVEEVLKTVPADIMGDDEEVLIDTITGAWESIFHRFLANDALLVIEAMDIPSVVENRINSFDIAFAEDIIISLSKRELSAITWLGALLGAVMGLLSPLLASIY